jgi:hypothetical protein
MGFNEDGTKKWTDTSRGAITSWFQRSRQCPNETVAPNLVNAIKAIPVGGKLGIPSNLYQMLSVINELEVQ